LPIELILKPLEMLGDQGSTCRRVGGGDHVGDLTHRHPQMVSVAGIAQVIHRFRQL
jgi:hypothetical protein